MRNEVNISWESILKIVVVVVSIYIIWQLQGIILTLLLSMMLSAALYPLAKYLNRKFSMAFSSVLVIILLFIPMIAIFSFIIPTFVQEFPKIVSILNSIIHSSTILPAELRKIDFTQYTSDFGNYVLHSTSRVTGFITTYVTIIFLTLYMMIDFKRLEQLGLDLIPKNKRAKVTLLIGKIITINGNYIRGNLIISLVCTAVITIGLLLLQVPHAISLGIFAGILDLLPLIGAVTGAIPAIIIGFGISPLTGILVTILFIVYQQAENNILSPHIYNKILDLSPAVSFIAVLIGGALFGAMGAFIALPMAASIPTAVKFIAGEINSR